MSDLDELLNDVRSLWKQSGRDEKAVLERVSDAITSERIGRLEAEAKLAEVHAVTYRNHPYTTAELAHLTGELVSILADSSVSMLETALREAAENAVAVAFPCEQCGEYLSYEDDAWRDSTGDNVSADHRHIHSFSSVDRA
jgi:hypothetical protein